MTNVAQFFVALAAALLPQALRAGDWPQYRADGGRTGYTAETLPDELHLRWTRHALHRPQPAWPDVHWQRQTYDLAHQPVIAGGTLFYGSTVDGKVYALDAATGQRRWSFFTDGPVRFAPAVWKDRLLAVSDDGYLYCLAAGDGKLLWRKRGGPGDEKILGNGRLVSRWPARGGPVIHDDRAYFGAGLFPSQGFFLYAVDPGTGETAWVNDTSGNLRQNHITGGYAFGNVTAQGYLAVGGDALVVPTGRAVPAVFDRKTGKFKHFRALELSYAGGSWVMTADGMVFNSDMILDLDTGYTLSNKVGNAAEVMRVRERRRNAEVMIEAAASPTRLFVATGKRIKAIDRACPFDEDSDLWDATPGLYFLWRGPTARQRTPHKFMATRDLWSVPVDCQGSIVVAGDKVIAGGTNVVSAIAVDSRKTVWSHEIEGTARGLAVADGRLYVSTDAGRIYCFGKEKTARPALLRKEADDEPFDNLAEFEPVAREIIERSGVSQGYCLDVGCGRGELAYALARQSDLCVVAVDDDPARVAAARRALDGAGVYGNRVTVLCADLQRTNLPDYFANLVVSARSITEGEGAVPSREWQRLRRPYGGVAVLGKPGSLKVDRRGPLEGAGSWTHQFGNPANTSCSGDRLVRGPLGVLWFGGCGPEGMHGEKNRSPAPLFLDGRLYVQGESRLKCIDAYNGRLLWEVPIARFKWARCYNGSEVVGSNYCVTADGVYLSAYDRCRRLDAETGEELASFDAPKPAGVESPCWMQVFAKGDLLFGTLESELVEKGWARPGARQIEKCMWVAGLTTTQEATHLFAMDRESGELKWIYQAKALVIPNSVAFGNGRVYLIDRPIERPSRREATRQPQDLPGRLVALDAATGETAWTRQQGVFGSMLAVSEPYDVVLMGNDVKERGTLFCDYPQRLAVFRGNDGGKLWEREALYKMRPMIVGRTVVAEGFNLDHADRNNALKRHDPSAWDLLTGEPKLRANPVTGEPEPWVYGRSTKCSYATSCANMLLFRNAMTTYYDLVRDEGQSNLGAFRPSCFINVLPVGGIVLAPNTFAGCQCNTLMRTSLAFQPIEQEDRWAVFCGREPEEGVVRHLRLNLGALGDRRDDEGRLWLAMPRPPGYFAAHRSDTKTVRLDRLVTMNGLRPAFHFRYDMAAALKEEKGVAGYRLNADTATIHGTDTPWVAGSGCRGPVVLEVNVSRMPPGAEYRIRLHFAELEPNRPGERVFDVVAGSRTVLPGLDVVQAAGKTCTALVKEFTTVAEGGTIRVALVSRTGEPILSGIEVLAQ
ncbi:MAG: outer membrane protein assembly factor BamB family protein [Planctomycetota bacterium]